MRENTGITIVSLLCLLGIYFLDFLALFTSGHGNLFFFELGSLTLPSLILFLVILLAVSASTKLYFLLFFFVLLAFPAPIDDIFPSVPITSETDRRQVLFPLITRIDIFLWLGILKGLMSHRFKVKDFHLNLILKIVLLTFPIVILINLLQAKDLWSVNLILSYSFQYRYLVLLLLLISLYDMKRFKNQLVYGFFICLVFLLLEASVNTFMSKSSRLLSGSLSLNTFANISAAVGLYFFYLLKHRSVNRFLGVAVIVLSLFIVVKTGTRSAFLLYFAAYFFIYVFSNKKRLVLNTIKVGTVVAVLFSFYVFASNKQYIPDRYAFSTLVERIQFNSEGTLLSEKIQIAISKETNSLRTRLDLFDTSIQMASANPLTGIGPGQWNVLKNDYKPNGKFPNVLLDSHNDYLAMIAQYGIVLGILLALFIFYSPFKSFHQIRVNKGPLAYLFVLNFAMGIAALSNAGFFKHQVAAVLLFSACLLVSLSKSHEESTN